MAEQPTQEDIIRNINRIAEDFKSRTEEFIKLNQGFKELMASFQLVTILISPLFTN